MGNLPIPDHHLMPWCNRRMEQTFAYVKSVDRRFSTMNMKNIHLIARSQQCHTPLWLARNLDVIDDSSVKKAYYEEIEKYENAFTLEEAMEAFAEASSD